MGMSKYDRLLHILNMLRSRRNLNASRLAEECGVTERSIYRDIISLSEANIPIYYDHGYKLASDNFLPPLNFDFEEYTCLRLALESTPLSKTGRQAEVLKRIKAKIDAQLSEPVKQQRKISVETTHIEIPVTQVLDDAEDYYGFIEQAIIDDLCLDIHYESIDSGRTRRIVEPYFIVFRSRAFYFVAYCRLRKSLRTFRVDRILDLVMTDEHFVRDGSVNVRDYFEGSWQIWNGEPVEVVIEFTGAAARVVLSATHHYSETIEQLGEDHVTYRVKVNGLDEIKRWILGFGKEAQVMSPHRLREELALFGGYLSDAYSPNDN